jgi:hypothetical protein
VLWTTIARRLGLQGTLESWLLGSGASYENTLGNTELDVGLENRQVQELVSHDANALLEGIPLRAGYRTFAAHLHGWSSVQCTHEGLMLELSSADGRVTGLQFKGNRFVAVNIGLSGDGGCPPWPPSFLASPIGRL